jgi:hypothetical protein
MRTRIAMVCGGLVLIGSLSLASAGLQTFPEVQHEVRRRLLSRPPHHPYLVLAGYDFKRAALFRGEAMFWGAVKALQARPACHPFRAGWSLVAGMAPGLNRAAGVEAVAYFSYFSAFDTHKVPLLAGDRLTAADLLSRGAGEVCARAEGHWRYVQATDPFTAVSAALGNAFNDPDGFLRWVLEDGYTRAGASKLADRLQAEGEVLAEMAGILRLGLIQ